MTAVIAQGACLILEIQVEAVFAGLGGLERFCFCIQLKSDPNYKFSLKFIRMVDVEVAWLELYLM